MKRFGSPATTLSGRRRLLLAVFTLAGLALALRAFELQLLDQEFLKHQADARHLRTVAIPAHRGVITDRAGDPLAISIPVDSVWADPGQALQAPQRLAQVAERLDLDPGKLQARLQARQAREFEYLRRHLDPNQADLVRQIGAPGVYLRREYKRFYPLGEVTGHVLGFTDIDDRGQEGIELAFDNWLQGQPGAKRILRDRKGNAIADIARLRASEPGDELTLTLDRRLQFLAYRELKAAVQAHQASSGSVVILEPRTGAVLAMANQPAFNPNDRRQIVSSHYRNRAVTDVLEPGSTLKPFTIAMALAADAYQPGDQIDTRPGYYQVAGHTIQDHRNYGRLDLGMILTKSSNVGASQIALSLPAERLWSMLHRLGFGQASGLQFPGAGPGRLAHHSRWRRLEHATIAFGYGVAVTPLQLARAYAVLANDGRLPEAHLVKRETVSRQVMPAATARTVRQMLESVVGPEGTASRAAVANYRVAGKTGTVHKAVAGGYAEDRYQSLFVGMAPASRPCLLTVVVIDEPKGQEYYGGLVAAPVFARIMAEALRLTNVPPDNLPTRKAAHAAGGGAT